MTYTDGFIINADVVAYNEMHGIVPSNGERHVYPKHFTCPQTYRFFVVSGTCVRAVRGFRNGNVGNRLGR
ncbi:hypothetical protein NXX23_18050 [Bacteroides ovatus]|nr:hypothetical protein [Bacteroides ovatus]